MIDLLPLVRYVPAAEADSNGFALGDGDWVDSDLKDVRLEEHNSRCYFCLEDFEPPETKSSQTLVQSRSDGADHEPLRQYLCGHVFHKYCADRWMHDNLKCFLCKADLYLPEATEERPDWSALFKLVRGQDRIIRRTVNVDLLQTFQYSWYMQ
ncbi:hypothetical protein SCP_0605130 [Sparassis crispa]|uniref:RING-type domain-containing protein n=1 Tax=Sparassis crispa TaxID=139825 RepID=A0A401GS28_9APHY|nr:hypothetical protein SCP_0605130 [Sparassis crispa]GBE84534.1 hypothetical protein SCP_0605130 [Sparassis crispa]